MTGYLTHTDIGVHNSYTKVGNLPGETFKISRFLVKNHDSYTNCYTKITVKHEKTSAEFLLLRFSWCHRESNQGHKDFQSFALPTELWHQFSLRTTLSFDWDCKGRYFFFISKLFMKYFLGFYFVSSQSHWALWSKNITYQ